MRYCSGSFMSAPPFLSTLPLCFPERPFTDKTPEGAERLQAAGKIFSAENLEYPLDMEYTPSDTLLKTEPAPAENTRRTICGSEF